MDLIRYKFRPQVECEMRCAQSQDSESGTLINLPGLNPPFLFFVPITVSLQTLPPPSKNKHASNQLACRQPDVSGAREIPVT